MSVFKQLDENDHRLLGFVEFNGPGLYDIVGKRCSKSPMLIYLKHLSGFYNRDAIELP
jgi:hypothetical protein